jgi:hypothetical protein
MPQQLTEARRPINALYCGEGGTGKTTALATMANLGKVFAVNAEQGIEAGALERQGVDISNIEVFPGPGEEISQLSLEAQVTRIREELHKDPDAYAGVVVDPMSEVQQRFVEDLADESVERAARSGRDRSRWIKDQDNWTTCNSQMRDLIRSLRDLPCHFGMSTPLRRNQDDDGTVQYVADVSPGLQRDLFGWVAVVCVTSVVQVMGEDGEEDEYRGLFGPYGKYLGKDRLNVLPKWMVNPTFDRIVAYRDGELSAESDPVMVTAKERAQAAKQAATKQENEKETEDAEAQ